MAQLSVENKHLSTTKSDAYEIRALELSTLLQIVGGMMMFSLITIAILVFNKQADNLLTTIITGTFSMVTGALGYIIGSKGRK